MALKLPASLADLSPESFNRLSPRDRKLVLIGGAGAVLLLLFGLIVPLDRSVAHERDRLTHKRADLAAVQRAALELRDAPQPPAASGESLLVIVDRSARERGLANSLAGSEPGGPNSLSVRLEKASFDKLVEWLAQLSQQNGIAIDSANIEKVGTGTVNAAIVLHSG